MTLGTVLYSKRGQGGGGVSQGGSYLRCVLPISLNQFSEPTAGPNDHQMSASKKNTGCLVGNIVSNFPNRKVVFHCLHVNSKYILEEMHP